MKHIITLILAFVVLIFISSCKKDKDDQTTPGTPAPVTNSEIRGTIKTPSGKIVGSAKVISGTFQTLTDHNGEFKLNLPEGLNHVIIQTGQGKVFRSELDLNLAAGAVLYLDSAQSVLKQVGTMAYVIGAYDEIQTVIFSMGYNANNLPPADLSNMNALSDYDALFLNCGIFDAMDSVIYTNLSAFLYAGGSIYASDYSVDILTGDGNWRPASAVSHTHSGKKGPDGITPMATCMTPELGGFIEDSSLCTSKTGLSTLVTGATINDPAIVNLLGQPTIDIHYDLGAWDVISVCDAPFTPVITDALYGPLAVQSTAFGPTGGIIFYTTFHNHPQGAISTDVRDILQYFILNL
jgi:hypothetical protein